MKTILDQCQWPNLAAKYDSALRSAVGFIAENLEPVGIIASGTILRGNPDPASDLDIYVIHRAAKRQRIQKFFDGVPAEIFINPPEKIERYFAEEQESGRPLTAHMLATGFVVLSLDPVVEVLREKAKTCLTQPPTTPPQLIEMARYSAAATLEDAIDLKERDPAVAHMLASVCIVRMLHHVFRKANVFLPRDKDLIEAIRARDPELASWAVSFYETADLKLRLELAGRIADRTIGVRGFYEWTSEPAE